MWSRLTSFTYKLFQDVTRTVYFSLAPFPQILEWINWSDSTGFRSDSNVAFRIHERTRGGVEGERRWKGAASVRVDDVGITCPEARAIPAIFNLFQVPFRGGEKKGATPPPPPPPPPRLPRRREIPLSVPSPSPHLISPRPISRIRYGDIKLSELYTSILTYISHIPAMFDAFARERSCESNSIICLLFQ